MSVQTITAAPELRANVTTVTLNYYLESSNKTSSRLRLWYGKMQIRKQGKYFMASTESLNELTKDQLFQLAEDNNVEVKKSATKTELVEAVQGSVSQEDVDALTGGDSEEPDGSSSDDKVEARPIGQGKDPLAEGERLYNPTNTEAETHYDADRSELNDEDRASKIRGQNANERAEEHNAESPEDIEDSMREEAQDLHEEVTTRTEEEQAEESQARSDALAQDPEVKAKLQ